MESLNRVDSIVIEPGVVQIKEKPARRVPMQKRAREKYDAVLDACTVVLAREGYNGTTTSNIAGEAGVAIGSLYEYFPNKESIFSAYLESRIGTIMDFLVKRAPTDGVYSSENAMRDLLSIAVKATQRNQELLRVLVSEVPGIFDFSQISDLESKWAAVAKSLAGASALELDEEEVELKTYILTNALYGFFIRSVFSPTERDPEEVTDELLKLIVAYGGQE